MRLAKFSEVSNGVVLKEGGGDFSAVGRLGVWEEAFVTEFRKKVSGDRLKHFDLAGRERLLEHADFGSRNGRAQGGVVGDGGRSCAGFRLGESAFEKGGGFFCFAQEQENAGANLFRVEDHFFEPNFEELLGGEGRSEISHGLYELFPAACGGQNARGADGNSAGRFRDVPAVADEVENLGVWEEGQNIPQAKGVMGGFIAPALFAMALGVERKKGGDEGGCGM